MSVHEVAILARTLAVAAERFAVLAPVQDADAAGAIHLAPGNPGQRDGRRLLLRRRDDGAGRTRCVFLVTTGSGRPVCGAGVLAPDACKRFPAPFSRTAPSKVAGCWRTWQPPEVAALGAQQDHVAEGAARDASFVQRWNAHVAERTFPVPESTFFDALLAGTAAPDLSPSDEARAGERSALLPEPRSSSGCATCTTSRCCVVFDPELTGADLVRLVDALGLDEHDVAELKPTRKDQAGPDAIQLGDERAWDLRLRRTGAQEGHQGPGEARRCGFLVDLTSDELAPANRCGVYAHRPLACRLFPSDLTSFGVMLSTPEAICPPQAWAQERADLPTLHHLHLLARSERERFRVFVEAWNAAAVETNDGPPRSARASGFMPALIAFERAFAAAPDAALPPLARACVAAQPSK